MQVVINSIYVATTTNYNGSHYLCHANMKMIDSTRSRKPMAHKTPRHNPRQEGRHR